MDTEIVELHEREARVFPRGELFDLNGRSRIFSHAQLLSAVELRETLAGTELRVLGLVGFLPLTEHISLNLKPKFPLESLWFMLEIADSSCETLLPIIRSYANSDSVAPSQLLVRSFCFYLKEISSLGVAKSYLRKEYTGYFKPKLNFGKTVARKLSRGNFVDVCSDVFYFSADIKANEYLKSACLDFLKIAPRNKQFSEERMIILDALNALDQVPARDLEVGYDSELEKVPSWLLESYRGALMSYSILLGHRRIGFSYVPSGNRMPSFLFSLDTIFEDFIRNYLRKHFERKNIFILDGNVSSNYGSLFSDNKKYPVKPDLIFKNKMNEILCVGEVKYKPKIKEVDRYQLISHVISLSCPIGVWISPSKNEITTLEYVGAISTGARFYHCRLSLSDSLNYSSDEMAAKIENLIL